jgi:NADPH:quinone reductase-like Zn-dependent oxidoreductase
MAKVVRFHKAGGPEVLQLDDVEIGEPGPEEVRLRIDAIGLNRAEVMYRGGYYLENATTFPATLGYEAAGVVEAVGTNVARHAVGDPVSVIPGFSLNSYGTYAERAILPASAIVARPVDIDPVAGAAVWMQYLTAYGALIEIADLRAGDFVLITAASCSVGIAAIQVANRVGAIPIATTRTAAKRAQLLAAGAAYVIVTGEENLVERVRDITGGSGASVVFDPIAGPGLADLASVTAPGGTLFVYGMLSLQDTPFVTLALGMIPVNLRTYTLFEITTNPDRLRRAEQYVLSGLRSGAFTPVIDRTFDLGDIAEAHEYMESNVQIGKIVVTVQH